MTSPALPVGSTSWSFADLRNDLGGGTGPISMNETRVRNYLMTESGAISMSSVYRKTVEIVGGSNVNIRNAAITAGWNGTDRVQITVNTTTTLSSSTVGSYAATLTGSFSNGVLLLVAGKIQGMGGDGGDGNSFGAGGNGGQSGSALYVYSITSPNNKAYVHMANTGIIAAGGGGGGGGGAAYFYTDLGGKSGYGFGYAPGGGGGGGAGYGTSPGGANNGGTGGPSGGGAGYTYGNFSGWTGSTTDTVYGGTGGAGGFWGSAGSAASACSIGVFTEGEVAYASGSGGSSGASITGYTASVSFYNGGGTVYGGYN